MLEETPTKPPPSSHHARGWWIFLAVLFAPALAMMIVARWETAQGLVATVGCALAAIYCGYWTSFRTVQNPVGRAVLGALFAIVLYFVSLVLCCFGCMVVGGGYRMH